MSQRDFQTIAQLFDRCNRDPSAGRVQHTVHHGWRNTRAIGQFIGGISRSAQSSSKRFATASFTVIQKSPLYEDIRFFAPAYVDDFGYTFLRTRNMISLYRQMESKTVFF